MMTPRARNMMTAARIRGWVAEWEAQARDSIDECHWYSACGQIWAAGFILGDTSKPGYVQPLARIPRIAKEARP